MVIYFLYFFLILFSFPAQLPTVTLSPAYWSTGSAYGNYLTSSISMSMVYGEVQEQYSNSTFKPINEPFTIQVGDEIRIQGREDRVFLVNEVETENTNFGVKSSILNIFAKSNQIKLKLTIT